MFARGLALRGIRFHPLAAKAWKHVFPPSPPHSLLIPDSLLQNCHSTHGIICTTKTFFKEKMSRLPDNPSPKGERGEERFGEETVGDLVSANTSQGLVCPCHGHPDCQGHPILEPDELWVHFHPVQELRKWLLCWSSHLLCSLGAISPGLFLDVLKSQRLAGHFKT